MCTEEYKGQVHIFLFCRVSRNFDLLSRKFDLVSRKFDLLTRNFDLLTRKFDLCRIFELLSRIFEILSRIFELISRNFEIPYKIKKYIYLALILFRTCACWAQPLLKHLPGSITESVLVKRLYLNKNVQLMTIYGYFFYIIYTFLESIFEMCCTKT